MNDAERDQLLDLHRAVVNAHGAAERNGQLWTAAHAADDAFRAYVLALE